MQAGKSVSKSVKDMDGFARHTSVLAAAATAEAGLTVLILLADGGLRVSSCASVLNIGESEG